MRPPDPDAPCSCGHDSSPDGARTSIVCPKHDGVVQLPGSDPDMSPDEVAAERRFSRVNINPDPVKSMALELEDD